MRPLSHRPHKKHRFFTWDSLTTTIPPMENHAHSTHSDGSDSLEQMAWTALRRGITQLIMTEHTEPSLTHGKGWFSAYMREGKTLRETLKSHNLELVLGLEVPITDFSGGLLWDESMKNHAEFVLGAVHAFPGHGWDMRGITPDEAIELEYRGLLALVDNPLIDAIAHPGGVCTRFVTPFPQELFEDVVQKAAAREMAIELNPAYLSPMEPYIAMCQRHGVLISPGSNAHAPGEIGLAQQVLDDALTHAKKKTTA